jgi:amphi-Trp domain-containing protein
MGRGERIEFCTITEVERVAEYLSRIADGLRAGRVNLVVSDQPVRLEPADIVGLRLEAGRAPDDGSTRLGVSITWPAEASAPRDGSDDRVPHSAGEPHAA